MLEMLEERGGEVVGGKGVWEGGWGRRGGWGACV